MKRKTDRDLKPKPRPTVRQIVQANTGLSDLELTDMYNAANGTRYPSPLSEKQLKELYEQRF